MGLKQSFEWSLDPAGNPRQRNSWAGHDTEGGAATFDLISANNGMAPKRCIQIFSGLINYMHFCGPGLQTVNWNADL